MERFPHEVRSSSSDEQNLLQIITSYCSAQHLPITMNTHLKENMLISQQYSCWMQFPAIFSRIRVSVIILREYDIEVGKIKILLRFYDGYLHIVKPLAFVIYKSQAYLNSVARGTYILGRRLRNVYRVTDNDVSLLEVTQ